MGIPRRGREYSGLGLHALLVLAPCAAHPAEIGRVAARIEHGHDGLWLGTCGASDGIAPVRPHTLFQIGSVTKTLVAATILRLAEEGWLNLEDTVGQWLPALGAPNISSAITIRQLLNHRAGTYHFGDDPDFRQALFADWTRPWQPEEVLHHVKAPCFAPDTDGQYSNTGDVLLGLMRFDILGREHWVHPLAPRD